MKKNALLMLVAGFGIFTEVQALPVNQSGYAAPVAGAADSAIFEVLARLEQLQLEVQQLRGMVEEQSQTIADLERKQSNMYSDLDDRVQTLAQPGQQGTVPTPPPSGSEAVQQPAPTVAVAAPSPAAVPNETPVQPQTAPVTESKPVEPAPGTVKASEKERYQQAYDALRNGHNAQAIQMFEALQADYPAGELGDNTLYWLGEAYKINRDYDKARAAFSKVASQYPQSAKVPDALLKLGYIEFEQQNPAKARDYLTRITTSYPTSTAAHLAAKKLAQMPQ